METNLNNLEPRQYKSQMNFKYGKLMTIVQFACGVNMFFKIDPLIAKLTMKKPFHGFANRDDTSS
jgi:hypothetical protein